MMLQDIAPRKLDNHYDPEIRPAKEDTVLMIRGREILADTSTEIIYPKAGEIMPETDMELRYLFSIDGERFFAPGPEYFRKRQDAVSQPDGDSGAADEVLSAAGGRHFTWNDLKKLRETGPGPAYRVFAAYTAKHLSDWYRDTVFCGRCGTKMEHSGTERAMCCPSCGYTAYPRIMPAVIVGVLNGENILLTRYRRGYDHNALIAGFTEIGETLEETVAREVYEEAGIRVKNIRYYKSQPWGIANDLLAGYYCDVDGDDHITMDSGELKYAQWVRREDIELQPDESSLTNEMMKRFKEGNRC